MGDAKRRQVDVSRGTPVECALTPVCGRAVYEEIWVHRRPSGNVLRFYALLAQEPCWSQLFMEIRSRRTALELVALVHQALRIAQEVWPPSVSRRIRATAQRFKVFE
jgi:hypothetical protein